MKRMLSIQLHFKKPHLGHFISVFDENHIPLNGTDIYINGTLAGNDKPVWTQYLSRTLFPAPMRSRCVRSVMRH